MTDGRADNERMAQAAAGTDPAARPADARGVEEPEIEEEATPQDRAEGDGVAPAQAVVEEVVDEVDEEAAEEAPMLSSESAALEEAERLRDQYLDHLRRERAEFDNFRKRTARERAEALDRGAEQVVAGLLGVLDNFGFVLKAADSSPDDGLAKGATMVHGELMEVLRKAGLEEVPGAGAPFDPNWHEAVMQAESDEPVAEPIVVEVLRPGYRFKGRVLRPASVSVAQ